MAHGITGSWPERGDGLLSNLKLRLTRREDSEHEQILIRICIVALLAVYFGSVGWFLPESPALITSTMTTLAASMAVSLSLLAWLLASPGVSTSRRVCAAIHDSVVLTACLLLTGEIGTPCLGLYFWITLGYGFRYGVPYLRLSQIFNLTGFAVVMMTTPFWHDHLFLSGAMVLTLIAIPSYASRLIRTIHEAKARAEAHSSAKSDFIAMVSHEFRTPLHGIIGHAQLLELTSLSNEQATYLRHLRASTAGLLDLVESTLDVSRIEAGDSPVQRSPTNLRECVLECLTMIEVQVRARGIRLLAHVDPALPASVSMDRKSVREVLLNLTGNAVKFTDSGSVEVTVSYRDPGPVGFRLVFSISDSGIGIAKENFDRVFAKFSQVHEGSTRPATGAGLGTTIARDLARRMGGDITLDSDLGRGSTLAFDIPVEGSLVIPPRAGRLGTVMLAGAVDAALDPLIASLRALGCETTVATEVTVAIGIINATASPPEWVFVPESLGIAAAQRIAQAAQARAGDRADLCRLIVLTRASAMSAEFAHAGFSGSMRRGASQSEVAATLMGRLAPEGPTPTTVRVPVQTPAPPEAPDGDDLLARLVAELKPIQYVKVLLVDDNSVSRLMISTWLEKLGIEHSVAKYAYEFLEMAADVSFDLFLIDQHMPDLDGIEALNLYRTAAADPVVPALLVTADVKEETVQHALRAGFACVVPKPMDIEVLVHAMVQAFAPPSERPQPEQLQAAVQARAWSLNAPRGGEAEDLIDARQIMNATSIPSGDVTEFARNLIHGYAQDAWIMFAGMTDALSRSDFTALRDHAETLKGSSRSVGATAVARLCADMASTPTDTLRSQGAQMIATIEDTVRRSVAAFEAATSKRN